MNKAKYDKFIFDVINDVSLDIWLILFPIYCFYFICKFPYLGWDMRLVAAPCEKLYPGAATYTYFCRLAVMPALLRLGFEGKGAVKLQAHRICQT